MSVRAFFLIYVSLLCCFPATSFAAALGLVENDQYTTNKILVKSIHLKGQHLLPETTLRAILTQYEGRELAVNDLVGLQNRITQLYTQQGYINSSAHFPEQELDNGVLVMDIIHGRLTKIDSNGNRMLDDRYLNEYIKPSLSVPFNVNDLNLSLAALQEHEMIKDVNARLWPTDTPGEAALELSVKERNPFSYSVNFDNHQSPSIGQYRVSLLAGYYGLANSRDKIHITGGLNIDEETRNGVKDFGIQYVIPLSIHDSKFELGYSRSDYTIIEDAVVEDQTLRDLDIESQSQRSILRFHYPMWGNFIQKGNLLLGVEQTRSETSILGQPTPLSIGVPEDGKAVTSSLQLGLDWNIRQKKQRASLIIMAEQGIDAAGATISNTLPDSQYKRLSAQASYTRRMIYNHRAVWRVFGQLVDEAVLPAQKFAIGGMQSIRGYRRNMFVRDNGFTSNLELYYSLTAGLYLVPFLDYGSAWSNRLDNPDIAIPEKETLYSSGLGLVWYDKSFISSLYWATPLKEVVLYDPGELVKAQGVEKKIQGDEVYFSLSYRL